MREIKFRARDKQNMIMGNVKELGDRLCLIYNGGQTYGNRNNYEIMQYTGLKDKNGVEIYEGDIVKGGVYYDFDDGIGVVKFGEFESDSSGYEYSTQTCYGWYVDCSEYLKDQERYDYYANTFIPKKLKVIGNIHQNHELVNLDSKKV